MKISKRIKILLDSVDVNGKIIYDIGCDHGIVGYNLLCRDATCRVVFSDISSLNLEKAMQLCGNDNNVNSRAKFIQCNGVPKCANKDGVGLVFGLGGISIIKILQENENLTELYLQPTTSIFELRDYLYGNNYEIVSDKTYFYNGVNLDIIHIKKSNNCGDFSFEMVALGKDNLGRCDDEYKKYLQKQLVYLSNMLAKVDVNMLNYNVDTLKIEKYRKRYNLISKMIKGDYDV